MSFVNHLELDRRLVILRALQGMPGYSANESVMQQYLAEFGHDVSRSWVRDDFDYMSKHGLLTVENVAGRILVATLTERGSDVATGRSTHPGVKRPGPPKE